MKNIFPEIAKYWSLRLEVAKLVDASEREDLLAEIQLMRSTSVGVSVLCALDDIQTRYPLLLPFLLVLLGLKIAF